MTITIPLWILWTLGIIAGGVILLIIALLLAVVISNGCFRLPW